MWWSLASHERQHSEAAESGPFDGAVDPQQSIERRLSLPYFQGGGSMDRPQRRGFLIAAGAFLAAPFATEAQQPGKIARIGFLSLTMAGNPRGTDSFRLRLREHGYVEGRDVVAATSPGYPTSHHVVVQGSGVV
jgi:hypothetical protein